MYKCRKKPINRIKVTLVENGRTNKWLAQKLKVSPSTVSRWCTNDMQPSLETLLQISDALNVNVRELLVSNR
ncbi:MAG: helix-turn-helix transcriptional regulator [Bacteroidota bacterium]